MKQISEVSRKGKIDDAFKPKLRLTSIILQIFIQYLLFVSLYYQMYLAQPH